MGQNKQDLSLQLDRIADHRFTLRIAFTVLLGLVIAGALTWFMHVLIETSHKELDESIRANLLDFVRVKREESSERKQVRPKRPQNEQAPPAPPTPQASNQATNSASLEVSVPVVSAEMSVDVGLGLGVGDGEYLPIVKVAPAYPARAASQGIEGSCTVEYTVTTTGATRDISVVEGLCVKVFASSSIRAAKKFKYKPRVVDGNPVEVPNVRNRFDYSFEQGANN